MYTATFSPGAASEGSARLTNNKFSFRAKPEKESTYLCIVPEMPGALWTFGKLKMLRRIAGTV